MTFLDLPNVFKDYLEPVSRGSRIPRPVPPPNESKLLTQNFNVNAINVQNSKSVTVTLGQQL